MLTSFFNKSKPTNFVIVFGVTLLAFLVARKPWFFESISLINLFKELILLLVAVSSILLLNFIVSKNNLTRKRNFEVLLYGLFLLFITQTTNNSSVLLSNFFILLALRRIISLRTSKDVKKKLFDAAFWIGVASLFYFWAILFFVLIIMSLILYTDNKIRHWIIPFLGIFTVFLVSCAFSIIRYDDYFKVFYFPPETSYDFSTYNTITYLVAITVLLSFGVWSSFFYLQNIRKQKKVYRVSFKTIILAAIIGFLIVIQAPNKNGSEFLFLFAPLSIIVASYLEIIKEKWFKEVFLAVLILVPFVLLFL